MMTQTETIEYSKTLFDEGYGCAEAVLMAIAKYNNIQSELIPRIASGLCAGLGKTNGTCGALSGGVLAISIIHGRDDTSENRDKLNAKVQKFVAAFKKKYETTECTELTGCDLSTERGMEKFEELNMHSKCNGFVGEVVKMILKND